MWPVFLSGGRMDCRWQRHKVAMGGRCHDVLVGSDSTMAVRAQQVKR